MSEILIQCQDLHKRYGRKEALCGVNLRLESGKIVGLLGPNGSGKTTLIKILNGLLKPDQGMVTIDGEEPGIHTKSVISYLPDKPYFADWMKITDLLELFEDFYEDFDRARAEKMCQELGIDTKLKMKTLSKRKQREGTACTGYEQTGKTVSSRRAHRRCGPGSQRFYSVNHFE